MRITKVVTKKGDRGETSLVGGTRVSKSSPRVDAYGDVDELNSFLGLARTNIGDAELNGILLDRQNELFTLGSDLASPLDVEVPRIEEKHIGELEKTIERLLKELDPLKEFILPGGNAAGATLQVARAVARRAERKVVKLSAEEKINNLVLTYLNRLSDFLFVLARVANKRSGALEEQTNFRAKAKKPAQTT